MREGGSETRGCRRVMQVRRSDTQFALRSKEVAIHLYPPTHTYSPDMSAKEVGLDADPGTYGHTFPARVGSADDCRYQSSSAPVAASLFSKLTMSNPPMLTSVPPSEMPDPTVAQSNRCDTANPYVGWSERPM